MDASEIEGHLQHHEWRFQDDQAAWPFFDSEMPIIGLKKHYINMFQELGISVKLVGCMITL